MEILEAYKVDRVAWRFRIFFLSKRWSVSVCFTHHWMGKDAQNRRIQDSN